jgi:hypothetical protein
VANKRSFFIARSLWIFPAILLVLTVNQVDVATDLHRTLTEGRPAVAEIFGYESSGRVDITYDFVNLRVRLEDGTVIEREQMSLPHVFAPELEGRQTVDVRVLPGADQPIVIEALGQAHWRIAATNAAMSAIGFILLSIAVFAWNRYLRRKGDPAYRSAEQADDVLPRSTRLKLANDN